MIHWLLNHFSRDFDDINQITDLQLFSAIIFPASEPEVIVREGSFEKFSKFLVKTYFVALFKTKHRSRLMTLTIYCHGVHIIYYAFLNAD